VRKIKGDVTLRFVDRGRHDLKGSDALIAETVGEWLSIL
jgi:hypothetical protein